MKILQKLHNISNRWLGMFTKWFESAAGVWQTLVAVLIVVNLEFIFPSVDPHAFILMAVLTVYSGITQPALAYGNAQAAKQLEETLAKLEILEERMVSMEEAILSKIKEQ